jgi:hypothetical protein
VREVGHFYVDLLLVLLGVLGIIVLIEVVLVLLFVEKEVFLLCRFVRNFLLILYSISPTFYEQFLRRFPFDKKMQTIAARV